MIASDTELIATLLNEASMEEFRLNTRHGIFADKWLSEHPYAQVRNTINLWPFGCVSARGLIPAGRFAREDPGAPNIWAAFNLNLIFVVSIQRGPSAYKIP